MSNEIKLRFSEKELKNMSSEDRKAIFGGTDPFDKNSNSGKGPGVSGLSLGLAVLAAVLLIVITTVMIQFVIQPQIVEPLSHEPFVIPVSENHPILREDLFLVTEGYWNQSNFEAFLPAVERLLQHDALSGEIPVLKELHLYALRAKIFTEQFEDGRTYAQFIQSRYPDDYIFMSDVFYHRGHITLQTSGYKEAYGAFRESHILGGRYSEQAGEAMRTIDRMSRPLW